MKNILSLHFVVAVFVLALSFVLYVTWYTHVTHTSAKAAALQSEVDLKESETGRAIAARDALGAFSVDGSSTNAHFVSEKDVVPFLEEVQKIGTSVGAKTTVVSVASDTVAADPSIRLSLGITGTFDAVLRTLGRIEHSSYAMRTEMFDLKTSEATPGIWTAHTVLLVSIPLAASSTPPTP